MKTITKFFLFFIILTSSSLINAQSIAVKGGLSISNMLIEMDNESLDPDFLARIGYHFGASVDFPLNDFLSVEPGLLFETKGCEYKYDIVGVNRKYTLNLNYISIPIKLNASYEINKTVKVFGGIGPYVGFGFGGEIEESAIASTLNGEYLIVEDISWGSDEDVDDFKTLDVGMSVCAGLELESIFFMVSYDLGLVDITSYSENSDLTKNRVFKVSVGYKFEI